MIIYVLSKKDIRSQWYRDKKWFEDSKKYFITISGIADKLDWAYPYVNERVLRLKFDDVTEEYFKEYGDDPSVIYFDEEIAKQIHTFVKRIPSDSILYINCAAGVSRSGAVGFMLNEYFNENNKEDYQLFFKNNPQIQPNPFVKRILKKELFGEIDYSKIF